MPKFERSRERKSKSSSFRDHHSSRGSGRESPSRQVKNRRDLDMTKVICSSCGDECEVPFKPTTNKPLFCSNCFKKEGGSSSSRGSSKDLSLINEKLDKIMKALKI
ncbi:hypothetical protein HQ529_00450 [Candidatus Woesearchaeota archaeon]|nr:hypothetical protein [Candidatus Woesearchaeota archaeon]